MFSTVSIDVEKTWKGLTPTRSTCWKQGLYSKHLVNFSTFQLFQYEDLLLFMLYFIVNEITLLWMFIYSRLQLLCLEELHRNRFKDFTIKLLSVTRVKGPLTKRPTQVNKVHMQRRELTLCGNAVHPCARLDGNSPLSMLSRYTHVHTNTHMH